MYDGSYYYMIPQFSHCFSLCYASPLGFGVELSRE